MQNMFCQWDEEAAKIQETTQNRIAHDEKIATDLVAENYALKLENERLRNDC